MRRGYRASTATAIVHDVITIALNPYYVSPKLQVQPAKFMPII